LLVSAIDLGINNITSVQRAFSLPLKLTDEFAILEEGQGARRPDLLILPGLGKFGTGMAALEERTFIDKIKTWQEEGTKIVGICLGMQLLGSHSEESPGVDGLNLIRASVSRLPVTEKERIPHVGWAGTNPSTHLEKFSSLSTPGDFYFVHSYHLKPENENNVLTTSYFGKQTFVSSILQKNILGFQFHPEKSGSKGRALVIEIIDWARNEG